MATMEVVHRSVKTNGIEMHIAEQGSGPLVLFLHGFPELWFSWRHQMAFMARHGYRAVAPDLRGYGDTEAPPLPYTSYTVFHIVGDIVGLLDTLGEAQAFVVGHDWGALIAWHLCLLRPDKVKALVNLGVPFWPRSPLRKPVESMARAYGDGFYINQFQEPGRAEKAFACYDALTIMKKFLLINKQDLLIAPPGQEVIDSLEIPSSLPPWITEEELQYFASKFQKSGFTGPLNYYRAMDLNWELMAPWQGAKISVPTKFIVGNEDIGFQSFGTKYYVIGPTFKEYVPNLEVMIIEGHHFIQQEKAKQVNDEILSFFGNRSAL
ncbi:hypothetical protein AMTRI_Chr03g53070 [Amborella trichopoda]|uniref:soluble epoxide hydrolase n=1 Tax=Amborella trichopoda TaxID=13333 RepID=W1P2N7_AMBTC|nr:uncharacterized protein LOC18429282 [Amborella trichopoda]ERN01200.1 hypothetical protein AMTR_s00002p00235860 [Amborella trichopoda]|eukprot:XP_006838631.1 uncharacterized protein LOC18429282 [Amborella trichopoda]